MFDPCGPRRRGALTFVFALLISFANRMNSAATPESILSENSIGPRLPWGTGFSVLGCAGTRGFAPTDKRLRACEWRFSGGNRAA
mgnify:CR=1 FL=1